MKLKAIVTSEFTGRPDGDSLPRVITVGEEVHGDLARTAINNKWADELKTAGAKKPAAKKPAARKATARKAAAKKH